jgi:ATP-dependent RNA helicase HelY
VNDDFELDEFQKRAMDDIDQGRSVVVAAPTGSGKTVVAEHAIRRARSQGAKAFYTTPIKALSNQKFHDLSGEHGPGQVGLLTGDHAVHARAGVVVMTTEVLRNMLYASSPLLEGLGWVVLDEVHYLEDRYRGPVWEEVILHLPRTVGLVCLSATVSNAGELADWVATVRGPTGLVVEEQRPVPLRHAYVVGEKGRERPRVLPTLKGSRPNPEGERYDVGGPRRGRGARPRWVTPRRAEVVAELRRRDLLPTITFIFSRAGCDDAARAYSRDGPELTTPGERRRIGEIVDEHLAVLSEDERRALDLETWRAGVLRGVAAHHAGLVPPCKEAVEACFREGIVKVVFATETLALGVNLPARSVVIERLTKFGGEHHHLVTPSQYTQITGRAGRRGIDPVGHAWVLWSPWVTFEEVAGLASSRSFDLRSAFRPTYNMVANLVRRHDREEAVGLLRSSFGQYQAARETVRLAQEAEDRRLRARQAEEDLQSRLGPGESWRDLLDGPPTGPSRQEVEQVVRTLRPGDAVRLDQVVGVVLTAAQRGPFTRITYVDGDGSVHTVHSTVLERRPETLGRVALPQPFLPHDAEVAQQVAAALAALVGDGAVTGAAGRPRPARRGLVRRARRLAALWDEVADLQRQADEGDGSLVHELERVLRVLDSWAYLDGWHLTDRGALLLGVYHEADLLIAEVLARGLLDGLGAADLAAVLSSFVYEHRGPETAAAPHYPTRRLATAMGHVLAVADELAELEQDAGGPRTRRPDPGFVAMAQAWAAGGDLSQVLADEVVTGGDFVRMAKQLVDLLGQVARIAPTTETRQAAAAAAATVRRGVVAASLTEPRVEDDREPA